MGEAENQMFLMLGRLEGKVDAILSKQDSIEKRIESLEDRVDGHEELVTKGKGAFSVLHSLYLVGAGILGAFADTIIGWITK